MSTIQKLFMAVLPRRLADSMREDSMRWVMRCCTCASTRTIWEMGGIRWKAASRGKRTLFRCPKCQCVRAAEVVKL